MGSETGWIFYHSNTKSNLNMPGLTKCQGVTRSLWISGYTLNQWAWGVRVGEDQDSLELCFANELHTKITLHGLCLQKKKKQKQKQKQKQEQKKLLLCQRKRKRFRYRTCSNSLNDGAWWIVVLKVPNGGAKVLQLLHTFDKENLVLSSDLHWWPKPSK